MTSPSAMTPRERVLAALRGQEVDRVPIAFWRHFPGQDWTGADLARATVAYYARYTPDLVKLMPTGMYSVLDYGVHVRISDEGIGTTRYVDGPIRVPADWGRLPAVDAGAGALREAVQTVELVRSHLGPDVPVLQTIFSPLTMAAKLCGGTDPLELQGDHGELTAALERLTADVVAFGRACLAAGADGFFFATQLANAAGGREIYDRYGVPHDLATLDALRPNSSMMLLHLHGSNPFLDLADRYPVDGVNWHDRDTFPSLHEALGMTRRGLVGGISRTGSVLSGSARAAAEHVSQAIRETRGTRLVLTPGCVLPLAVSGSNLDACLAAAREAPLC